MVNGHPVDNYTIHHLLGGFAVGIFASFMPKQKYAAGIAGVIAFEIFEQNVLANWAQIIPQESLGNTLIDIVVGSIGSSFAIALFDRDK